MQNIAFLGLGIMGASMTANLARKGFPVKAWNRTSDRPGVTIAKEAGADVVPNIQEAVTEAAIIFTCVSDVPDVEEVILGDVGVAKFAPSGALVVDMSTIGRDAACSISKTLKTHNLRFLDAPVSGGDIGAKNGTLTIMVGGEETDFQQCQPVFAAMGKNIRHCGPTGSGQAIKMCNQVIVAIQMIALCEGITMANQQGIDPQLMIEVCSTGAAASWDLANLGPRILDGNLTSGFMIKHILKDLGIAQLALKDDLPGVELAQRLFKLVSELDEGKGIFQATQGMIRAYEH